MRNFLRFVLMAIFAWLMYDNECLSAIILLLIFIIKELMDISDKLYSKSKNQNHE